MSYLATCQARLLPLFPSITLFCHKLSREIPVQYRLDRPLRLTKHFLSPSPSDMSLADPSTAPEEKEYLSTVDARSTARSEATRKRKAGETLTEWEEKYISREDARSTARSEATRKHKAGETLTEWEEKYISKKYAYNTARSEATRKHKAGETLTE